MIDLDRMPISRLALLGHVQDEDPNRDLDVVALPTHDAGYRAAQAAGFALLGRIARDRAALAAMRRYDHDRTSGDRWQRHDWEEAEFAIRVSCVDRAAGHALAIAVAQGRDDEDVRALREGVVCADAWMRMTPAQRASLGWCPHAEAA